MKRIFTLLILSTSFLFAEAQIPNIIPYQGSISDTSGEGFEGDYDFEFKILDKNNANLWASGTVKLPVQNGNYSVSLGGGSQPPLDKSVFDLDELYLEISFNDGVNGKETLSPNVRILPVPYAIRSAYADSSSNSANFNFGDSLVLRDKNGDVRMVLNPNTGEFKMVDNDTVWYNLKTNSPTKQVQQLPNGGSITVEHITDFDDAGYKVTTVQYGDNKGKIVSKLMTILPNGDPNPLDLESYTKYCANGELEYSKLRYKYVRDTVVDGMLKYEGIHIIERWYDCNGQFQRYVETDPRNFTRSIVKPENTVVETVSEDEHVIIYTFGNDTFQSKINPKTGKIRHSKDYISYVVGMEGGKTVATYNNDSTGKSSSTTVDPDKNSAEHKNQDIQFYLPETNQQCFGTDLGNGDTLWFYMNNNGFEFNDVIIADGIRSDSLVAEYDGNRRVVIAGEDDGKSSTRYYDDLDRVIRETHDPTKGEVKKDGIRVEVYEYDANNQVVYEYDSTGGSSQTNRGKDGEMKAKYDPAERTVRYDGFDRQVYDERDLVYEVKRDSGTTSNSVTNKTGTVRFDWEYDGNENVVRTEGNGTKVEKKHNKDSTVTFVITDANGNAINVGISPKEGEIEHSKDWVRYVVKMEKGETVATYNNDSTKKSAKTTVSPDNNTATRENQDVQFYFPEGKQQCFGTDLGNGDTLWFYMNNNGFEFNDVVTAEGVKSDSFVAQYDGNDRIVMRGDKTGNSTTRFFDDALRVIEERHNPTTGEVTIQGVRTENYEYDANNNVVIEYDSTGGSKQTNQSGSIKIIESIDPKTGEITHTKEWIRHVVKMEKGQTVATYHNDSTKTSSSTTVNSDNKTATRKNQDIQFFLPTGNQQCFGTALGNGDTLWLYMNGNGFEFNDVIITDGIKSDSFIATYDTKTRVVITGDKDGNSTTYYYDDAGRIIEETRTPATGTVKTEGIRIETREYDANNNVIFEYDSTGGSTQTNRSGSSRMSEDRDPSTGTVTFDGYDRQVYDERDLTYEIQRDSGRTTHTVSNTGGTIRFEWDFDGNDNSVRTEGNGTKEEKKHQKDSTIVFVWTDGDGNVIDQELNPKKGTQTYDGVGSTTFGHDGWKHITVRDTGSQKNRLTNDAETVEFKWEYDGQANAVITEGNNTKETKTHAKDTTFVWDWEDDDDNSIQQIVSPREGTFGLQTPRLVVTDRLGDGKKEETVKDTSGNTIITTTSPEDGSITYQGVRIHQVDNSGWTWKTEQDSGSEKNSIANDAGTVRFDWDYDAEDNLVRTIGNGITAEKIHQKDTTILFVWRDENGNAIDMGINPKKGVTETRYLGVVAGQDFSDGKKTTYTYSGNSLIKSIVSPNEKGLNHTGVLRFGLQNSQFQTGFQFDTTLSASWFAGIDTSKAHTMALGFIQADSSINLVGGKSYMVTVPSSSFQSYVTDGTSTMGDDWNFTTSSKSTIGITTSAFVFKTGPTITFKAPTTKTLWEAFADDNGEKITTVVTPKDSAIRYLGVTSMKFENGNIQTGCEFVNGASTFGSTDTANKAAIGLSLKLADSSVRFTGGKLYIVDVPANFFQSYVRHGSSQMGTEWDFVTNGQSTIGITSSQMVFNSGSVLRMESPSSSLFVMSLGDSTGNNVKTVVTPQDSAVRYLGVTSMKFENGNIQTGCEFVNGASTFGSTDTANKAAIGLSLKLADSSVRLTGGKLYIVDVPSNSFQSFVNNGTTQMGTDWDFATSSQSTIGVTTSQIVFNSSCRLIQESPTANQLTVAAVDSNGNPIGLQMFPSQGLLTLDAGSKPATFACDIIQTNNSLFIQDTAFVNKFAAVNGNMFVAGNLQVQGNISKGGGTFRIDHPQDPYNKYLYHSFIESPDMMNIYNGNATTDENGEIVVELPDYFESLNMEFRYQLTCIGSFAQAIVGQEIEDNKFTIMTDKPNVKVSWQVTGIRKDAYANDNRVVVEVDKEPENVGSLLHTPNQTKK